MAVAHRSVGFIALSCLLIFAAATRPASATPPASYFDNSSYKDALSGGVRMIPIQTADGVFHVWTKRTGNNPRIKVLLLHGGPGYIHEYLEAFDSYFPGAGIEYYYYDQLGSAYSDQPDDETCGRCRDSSMRSSRCARRSD